MYFFLVFAWNLLRLMVYLLITYLCIPGGKLVRMICLTFIDGWVLLCCSCKLNSTMLPTASMRILGQFSPWTNLLRPISLSVGLHTTQTVGHSSSQYSLSSHPSLSLVLLLDSVIQFGFGILFMMWMNLDVVWSNIW